jgi:hypothetical protein
MKGAKIMDKNVNLAERDSKIIELYGKGKNGLEISKEVGVCNQTVYNVLARYGLHEAKKRKKRNTAGNVNYKKCPVCKASNNPKEAKFCCMCGADIRCEADILVEELNESLKICCSLLPGKANEEVRDALLKAVKYIENANK